MNDSGEGWCLGTGLTLVLAKKNASACPVIGTVTCDARYTACQAERIWCFQTSQCTGAYGSLLVVPRSLSAGPQPLLGHEVVTPGATGSPTAPPPGALVRCKCALLPYKVQLQSRLPFLFLSAEGTRCHRNSIGEPAG